MMKETWKLMSSHGVVLFYIAGRSDASLKQIAEDTELTERRVGQIVRSLGDEGLLQIRRSGRRNTYSLRPNATFRHRLFADVPISVVLDCISAYRARQSAQKPASNNGAPRRRSVTR